MSNLRKIVSAIGDNVTPDAGPAPMLQWVEIDQLLVDDGYQRPLSSHNWKSIRQIADGFKWSRFSPVLCAPVEGGLFAIIDGQHRTHAAAMCGYKSVPCQIVQMSPSEQAASFAAVNGNITKVTALNLLKAALAAGEPWAVECDAIAKEGGCRLMLSNPSSKDRKPGPIYAARMFRKLVESRPREALIKALKILMHAEGYCDNSDLWDGSLLEPMLLAMTEVPEYLEAEGFVSFLEIYDIWEAIDGIEDENKRRIGNGQPKISRKEGIRIDLMKAITEAMGEEAP
ncbi:ParB N-terminal domain-containing protein [Ochrobactrum sp. Marseille-Q0166]|uniref:ParB N-terminal domain-containing protein n=1 Tax=Ochrobactrum sp. Marseille-Q0166 TaxID=2761105 RepID=UPI001655B5C8|nr:ParB N-terminal domain-containing protein [Ochrobactrum sp. Marseille-Q0166]MBC8718216.1 ParB N-terminal domain-containing protein [Ochrobactrum sp. Marseille-Q0166]